LIARRNSAPEGIGAWPYETRKRSREFCLRETLYQNPYRQPVMADSTPPKLRIQALASTSESNFVWRQSRGLPCCALTKIGSSVRPTHQVAIWFLWTFVVRCLTARRIIVQAAAFWLASCNGKKLRVKHHRSAERLIILDDPTRKMDVALG